MIRMVTTPRLYSNRDLMKKGLRLVTPVVFDDLIDSSRRPDEEGIKTSVGGRHPRCQCIPTADLMKKGLRHAQVGVEGTRLVTPTSRPDEEGIKTPYGRSSGRTGDFNRRPEEEGIKTQSGCRSNHTCSIPTADLVKKGLRLRFPQDVLVGVPFQPQT